ncbi:hypothetical protein [Burkholderia sp. BCC1047]|uniref:hypothetical protein n=1 Tax=Burkholderia sp. BCC1047 TaxID=2676299 RepID=UPI001589EF95|nr:hypothetical protein [Burkholderia sp. BCC1047]
MESKKESRKRSAEIKFYQEENRKRLAVDCEAYRQRADAGDPASQLNMSRILYHQVYLRKSNFNFVNYNGDMCGAEKSVSEASEIEGEAGKYLAAAMKGEYPPALTYFECRRYKEGGESWRPSSEDIVLLTRASEMNEARAKYLLAMHVYLFGINGVVDEDPEKAYRLLVDAYKGGDGLAAREIASMNDPSRYPDEMVAESRAAKSVVEKYWNDYRESYPGNFYGIPVVGKAKNPDPCSDLYRN